jgi:hypothetical protein
MKRLLPLIFLFVSVQLIYGQNYVFVLVDVSKSIKQSDLNGAKQALTDILSGNPLTNANIAFGVAPDLAACKLKPGDKLAIMKFGDKATDLANPPSPVLIQNIPTDIQQQVNSLFPTALTDNTTYLKLAEAKVAEYAYNNQIKEYRLYKITDGIEDDYGPNGKPDYTDYERTLVDAYGTTSNPISVAPSTKVKLNNPLNKDYFLEFIPKVDISKIVLPNQPPPSLVDTPTVVAEIKIVTNSGGKKNKEVELKDGTIKIGWTCTNCPPGIKYTVLVSEYDGGKFREIKKDLTETTATINVPDGKFKVTVSAQNFPVTSDTTFIKVSTGGFWWLIILIVILAAVGYGIKRWNDGRDEKLKNPGAGKAENLFANNKTTSTPNSSNTDYF